ncbi:MAG: hypothetical protein GKR94_26655 [Gammaproteobacteria bacterium]|nr:hypothetical protein [Gammaproteobacteria bacterium]
MIEATRYIGEFCSDRSHMRQGVNCWLAPPPPWPPIGEGHKGTLIIHILQFSVQYGSVIATRVAPAISADRGDGSNGLSIFHCSSCSSSRRGIGVLRFGNWLDIISHHR